MTRLKIAVLCSDEPHNLHLLRRLKEEDFELATIIQEPGRDQLRRRWEQRRYVDWLYGTYHRLRRRWTGMTVYRRAYFADRTTTPTPKPDLVVPSINASVVCDQLEGVRPDVTLVACTSMLGTRVRRAAGPTIVNLHGGYLPHYRGNHCYFFALANEDFDAVGTTLHFIDSGIDTGDLIEIVRPDLRADDNAESLYCRGALLAIERLIAHLHALERGRPLPRTPQPEGGRTYRTRDRGPYDDLRMWWRRRMQRWRVPERSADLAQPRNLCVAKTESAKQ